MIIRVSVFLNRTVVVDGDRRFDNLCGSYLQSQSDLSVDGIILWLLIGQLRRDVIGWLSVKP